MCGRVRALNQTWMPGMSMEYSMLLGQLIGTWGFENGRIFNARDDKLTTYWNSKYQKNRGILRVDSFSEKGHTFVLANGDMYLPLIYALTPIAHTKFVLNEFALVTAPAIGEVAKVHDRMPAIAADPDAWLKKGQLWVVNKELLKDSTN